MAYNYSRYGSRNILRNSSPQYLKQFIERDVRFIDQYTTPVFSYPSDDLLGALQIEREVWSVGSRFYKIADAYYGDPSLWWIIPWFNQIPLESDLATGDMIMIPKPLNVVLSFFGE